MAYHKYGVTLSKEQQKRLVKAFQARTPMSLHLRHQDLEGDAPLMLTTSQLNRIHKAKARGSGLKMSLSNKQITHMKKDGGLLEFLGPLLSSLLGGVASSIGSKLVGDFLGGDKKKKKKQPQVGSGLNEPSATDPDYGVATGKGLPPGAYYTTLPYRMPIQKKTSTMVIKPKPLEGKYTYGRLKID